MHLAPLDNSVVFKKLFRDPDILTAFFKDLTGIQLSLKPENIELEKKFDPPIGLIDIAFDIFAEDPQRRIIVEIQRVYYTYLLDRFTHYHYAAIMELQRNYQRYTPERTVYTIVWLTMKSEEPPFNQGLSMSRNYFESTRGVKGAESPHRMYLINPNYIDKSIPQDVADWLNLAYESIENPNHPTVNLQRPILVKAADLIAADMITATERAAIMDEREWQEKAQKERNEGLEIGRQTERIEIARSMLTEGMDIALIMRLTGLDVAEIKNLQKG
jgi:predicted transposase/invertase (TIGR01784 family)